MRLNSRIALAALAGSATALHAQDAPSDRFAFSGFGTVAASRTDADWGMFVREQQAKGATRDPSLLTDSNLGLKLSAQIAPWLSATIQSLTAQQTTPRLSTRLDWAYLKATPTDGITVRAGKLNIPNFMVSDSRRIGYANIALRPANEVYGLDFLNGGLKGTEVDYRLKLGAGDLTTSALLGSSSYDDVGIDRTRFRRTFGLNAVWDGGWYQLRVGHVETRHAEFGAFDRAVLTMIAPPGTDISQDIYRFTGIGVAAERNGVIVQAEAVQRRSRLFNDLIGAKGWYALAGYRLASVVPYVEIARRQADAASPVTLPQKTYAAGMRWDALSKADVKVQLEHVDTFGTNGASFISHEPPAAHRAPVTAASVAVDFVF